MSGVRRVLGDGWVSGDGCQVPVGRCGGQLGAETACHQMLICVYLCASVVHNPQSRCIEIWERADLLCLAQLVPPAPEIPKPS